MADDNNLNIFELIYEIDQDSPLYIASAYKEINEGAYNKALQILDYGMESDRENPAALLLKGVALSQIGETEAAKDLFHAGSVLINDPRTYEYYMRQFAGESISPEGAQDDNPGIRSAKNTLKNLINEYGSDLFSGREEKKENQKGESEDKPGLIVSDTMAGIYMAQESYEEALFIYGKLAEQKPEKKEYYDEKIKQIETLIEEKRKEEEE